MKDRKRIYAEFAPYDRTGIESFLEKKAAKGWMLESVNRYTWCFVRRVPMQLRFCVTFFPEVVDLDRGPSAKFMEYLEYCKRTGWKFVDTISTMQIFYTDAEKAVPIETDASVELETIHKAVKEIHLDPQMGPNIVLFGLFCLSVISLICFPGTFDETVDNLLQILLSFLYIVFSSIEHIKYYSWRKKAKKEVQLYGTFTETKSHMWMNHTTIILFALFAILHVYITSNLLSAVIFMGALFAFCIIVFVLVFASGGKKKAKMTQKLKEEYDRI